MLPFALNHMTAPRLNWQAFADLAVGLGCVGVEYRNDLPGPLFGGAKPEAVGQALRSRNLRFLALAEVKMFNDWSDAKRLEAKQLMATAVAAGAEAISLIPRNDGIATGKSERMMALRLALTELLPMLRENGLKAMVEPLGFEVCSLRYKGEAVEVFEELGATDTYKLVHDTFHHHLAGETEIFPQHTGIVHVSGVVDPALKVSEMRDPHRVLVDAKDRLDNIGQIRALRAGSFAGPISFEPFASSVHDLADPAPALRASMDYIDKGVAAAAA